mmetsp:Transcript_69254/g.122530  ORF Transcript_69254/g.122530 Transcript_69254/m.122530 type:complete len:653 (-) Transcript_69254:4-1962(-)
MSSEARLQALRALTSRLEQKGQVLKPAETAQLKKELVSLAAKHWAEEEDDDEEENEAETQIFFKLEELLLKFPAAEQEVIVAAFRPLRAEVSRRLAEWTLELDDWLTEVGQAKQPAQSQNLIELFREVDGAPQCRWYRQCPDMNVKAKFLLAMANVACALLEGSSLLKPLAAQSDFVVLTKKLSARLFTLPSHGNILKTWHEGRLAVYNATLSLAARRAVEKLKDDLQVALVSAVKRSANNPAAGKAKQSLQLPLRDWPMAGCPLARALLEFLLQRRTELGNLGRPSLRECPPHSLKPSTLRELLTKLDAFEVLDASGAGGSIIRLRWEAVAALAFKAVGTKPKASTAPPSPAPKASSGVAASREADVKAVAGAPPTAGAEAEDASQPHPVDSKIDFDDARGLMRLVGRGLKSGDDEWRHAWTQFCWQRNISTRLSSRGALGAPREALAAFVEQSLPLLRKADWAEQALTLPESAKRGREMSKGVRGGRGRHGAVGQEASGRGGVRRKLSSSRSLSSSFSGSEDMRRRKKKRKDKKSMLGYGGFFGQSKSKLGGMTPEVMMMRAQMMGLSMVMNSPLAMMGTQWQQKSSSTPPPPPPPPPPMSTGMTGLGAGPASSATVSKASAQIALTAAAASKAAARAAKKEPSIDMDDL